MLDNKKKITLLVSAFLVLIVFIFVYYFGLVKFTFLKAPAQKGWQYVSGKVFGKKQIIQQSQPIKQEPKPAQNPSIFEPQKTEFNNQLPEEFSKDIPIEKNVKLDQSYSLDYKDAKQSTTVFNSTKTMAENYKIYNNYLVKNNWTITSNIKGDKLSSFYAKKEKTDLNIVISPGKDSKTTMVSISELQY